MTTAKTIDRTRKATESSWRESGLKVPRVPELDNRTATDLCTPADSEWMEYVIRMPESDYDIWYAAQARKRAPAVAAAAKLIAEDRFDEAEETVREVETSIYSDVEIKNLYKQRLEELVAAAGVTDENRERAEAVFARALDWSNRAWPEPHTAHELRQYDEGRAVARGELVRILGYEPGA
jgi:hypothetical protein